jgi:hypothetical protein
VEWRLGFPSLKVNPTIIRTLTAQSAAATAFHVFITAGFCLFAVMMHLNLPFHNRNGNLF